MSCCDVMTDMTQYMERLTVKFRRHISDGYMTDSRQFVPAGWLFIYFVKYIDWHTIVYRVDIQIIDPNEYSSWARWIATNYSYWQNWPLVQIFMFPLGWAVITCGIPIFILCHLQVQICTSWITFIHIQKNTDNIPISSRCSVCVYVCVWGGDVNVPIPDSRYQRVRVWYLQQRNCYRLHCSHILSRI